MAGKEVKPYLKAFPNEPELLAFCLYYFPHRFKFPPGQFHRELANDILTCNRLVATTPPECGKSTLLNLGASIYLALEKNAEHVIIVSATGSTVGSTAVMWLGRIVQELSTNNKLLADYPFLSERKSKRSTSHFSDLNWETKQKSGIKLPNFCEIWALGFDQLQRGPHPKYLIFDDPESQQSVRTEYRREKWWDHYQSVGLRMLDMEEDVHFCWVGSYINRYCWLKRVIENDFPPEQGINFENWTRKKYKAEIHGNDGEWESFWPGSRWTKEKLQAKRVEMGDKKYLTEFMHEPPASETQTAFNSAWMHPYRIVDLAPRAERPHRDWIAVDAASGTKANADYRAWIHFRQFLTPADDFEQLIYIVDYGENRKPPEDVVADIVNVMLRNDPTMPYVRNSKEGEGGNWFERELRRQFKELKPPRLPNVQPVFMPGNKVGGKMENWDKCLSWIPRHHFAIPVHKKERISEVLLNFPKIEKDDLVDAFMVGMKYAETYPVGWHGRRQKQVMAHEYDRDPEEVIYDGVRHTTPDGYETVRFSS